MHNSIERPRRVEIPIHSIMFHSKWIFSLVKPFWERIFPLLTPYLDSLNPWLTPPRPCKRACSSKKKGGSINVPAAQPVILDTDIGLFIDNVFVYGLLLNLDNIVDLNYFLTILDQPDLFAKCAAKQITLSGTFNISVGQGATYPINGGHTDICTIPGLIRFTLKDKCET